MRGLLAAGLLLWALPSLASSLSYGFPTRERLPVAGGEVEVHTERTSGGPAYGYFPLRVYLSNRGGAPQKVQLSFRPSGSSAGRPVGRAVELAPKERRTVVLPVPIANSYGQLVATGAGITEGGRSSVYFGTISRPQRAVLCLGSPSELEHLAGIPPTYSSFGVGVLAFEPAEAPEELSSYVGFDAVVLATAEPESLREAQWRALEAYAVTGGTLVIGRPTRAVGAHLPLLGSDARGPHPYGFGQVELCPEDECQEKIASAPYLREEAPVMPQGARSGWSRRSYAYPPPTESASEATLLPQVTAPLGRFLLIIVAFTAAIGPGSVLVARARGPAALLFTIPVTAALTCGTIVAYSLIGEGFTAHAATRGYTLLDSKRRRAVTVGLSAYYANLAPREARYSSSTALLPDNSRRDEVRSPAIDWSGGARLSADFIPSRTYREWGVLSVEPTRARLVVRREGDGLSVQNALGSHLRAAHFLLDGKQWKVADLAGGAQKRAEPKLLAEPIPGIGIAEYSSRFRASVPEAAKAALGEGEFLAHVEGPSLLPMGGLLLQHHQSEHLVRGEVER
ncbi:MAG: hypothetical protein HYZ28_09540 [Myxococcales bacterium]|nr:hypothetical protein [Myxococcales bacterium]